MENKIKFCKECLYSNLHPLGITFDKNGICSGCNIHKEKDILDWKYRFNKLKKLVKKYKSKSRENYDCIVPVTGGNDSYFIVHVVKNKLGLNPLLVSYNKYFNTPLGISNLANLRIKFDSDIIFKNVNIKSVKKIVRFTLAEYQNIYWHILAGHSVFPVEVATKYKIPLIIWGAHQGLEQVGMFSHEHEVEMTRRYRADHDLFGIEAGNLLNSDNDLTEEDIWQYRYPDDVQLNSIGVSGIYLGNFLRWDPTAQHLEMIKKYRYKSAELPRTFDTYDHVDCYNYMNLHDYLKQSKHGYSKITDHVCREIRHKRITREEGINLVKFYETKLPKNLDLFCKWLETNTHSLNFVINRSKNKNFWIQKDANKYHYKGLSSYFKSNTSKIFNPKKIKKIRLNFKKEYEINLKKDKEYITFGKGID